MNLAELPRAVQALHTDILALTPVAVAMERVLDDYDVTEAAVRARFEAHYRLTPEEVAIRHPEDNSIDGFIKQFREANPQIHPSWRKHVGKRFYLIVDDKDGREVKKWFRVLTEHGLMIRVVDEVTHRVGEIGDSGIIDDVARQIGWKRWSHWPDVGPQPSRQKPAQG